LRRLVGVLHAWPVQRTPEGGGRAPAPDTTASVTDVVVQRLEDLVLAELEPGAKLLHRLGAT
jgi:hypothetical protein